MNSKRCTCRLSTIQWNPEFSETDQSGQWDGVSLAVLAGSIVGLWILLVFGSKLLNELTVHVALASNKEDQMEETSMLCVARKTDQISRTRDGFYCACLTSVHWVNASPGNRDLFLYFCSSFTSRWRRNVSTQHGSFVWSLCSSSSSFCPKLRWFPTSKWVKFVPKSWWIDLPTVRQRQKWIENKDFRPCAMKEWNERTFSPRHVRTWNTKTQLLVNSAAEDDFVTGQDRL